MSTTGRLRLALALTAGMGAVLAGCSDKPVGPEVDDPNAPAEFIAVRRAWLPGERAAAIAATVAEGRFGIYSSLAASIYADPDSISVVVRNPAFQGAVVPGLMRAPQFDAAWHITGLDIRTIDDTQIPSDTVDWLGVFWANPADSTWKGFIFAYSDVETVNATFVDTPAFDAAAGKSGAGGGEIKTSDGTYWEANGVGNGSNNKINVFSASYGAPSVVASGPWAGGSTASGTMAGRIKKVSMARVSGPTDPDPMQVDFSFGGGIQSVQLFCRFTFPANACSNTALHALHRAARAGTLSGTRWPILLGLIPAPAPDAPGAFRLFGR